jgi:CRISPR-associated protein Csb1
MQTDNLLQILIQACDGDKAAIRAVVHLVPVGGPTDKVFPPTYEGGQYAFEKRMIGGQVVETVLLDSVQSQANRIEQALFQAFQRGECQLPVIGVEIPGHGLVTTLDAPHRISDAIFRDCLWDGVPFRKSPNGKRIIDARAANATAFFEYCPTALLFGTWDSQGGQGVMGARIARSLVSEMIGLNAIRGRRTSSRIDPLAIRADSATIYRNAKNGWTLDEAEAVKENNKPKLFGDKGKPSEINHGNVLPSITAEDGPGGVTITEAVQTAVLSFAQIRQLSFPSAEGQNCPGRDNAGRAVIAALGLYGILLQWKHGYQLRSRCHLLPVDEPQLELVGATSKSVDPLQVDVDHARRLLTRACEHAREKGLTWNSGLTKLTAQEQFLKLVRLSDQMTEVTAEV